MIIRVEGLEKIRFKCEADKVRMIPFMTEGLIDAAIYVESYAANFPFRKPTGALNRGYTYLVEKPNIIAMFSLVSGKNVNYWRFVEYGTGIYSELGEGRQTPWTYYVEAGRWKGFHRTKGQKAKRMLTNATKEHTREISEIVKSRIFKGLLYGT